MDQAKQQFWKSFLRAAEAAPRQATELHGASGFSHSAIAVGVDDVRRRIVVISRDPDPRSAAFAQHDIESANPTYRVIVARPITINVARVAEVLTRFLHATTLGPAEWKMMKTISLEAPGVEVLQEGWATGIEGFDWAVVDQLSAWQDAIQQLSHVVINSRGVTSGDGLPTSMVDLAPLVALDPAATDRAVGNCPIPLYDFEASDAEILHAGNDIDAIKDVLRRRSILQYFYPPADQLVLGFAEGCTPANRLSGAIAQAPVTGHPLGDLELLPSNTRLEDVIDGLHHRGLLVEGEVGYDLSDEGKSIRAAVRFKPREGFLKKLSRILSVKLDANLKDFFS